MNKCCGKCEYDESNLEEEERFFVCSNPNCECHKTKEETAVGKVRHFYLNRLIDESGMSGLGKVAEGIVLPNGTAVMWWLVNACSVQVYQSIDDLHFIHKHGEKNTTQLVFEDKPIKTKEEGVKEKCNLGCKNRELCELLHTKPSQTKEHEHETFEEAKGYIADGKRRAFCKCGEELFNPPQDKLENWEEEFDKLSDVDHYQYDDNPRPIKDSLFGIVEYPDSQYELDAGKIKSFITNLLATQREELRPCEHISVQETKDSIVRDIRHDLGAMRQWLNEDRITEPSNMVTNEELEAWIDILAKLQ